jgi:hypothetical protein
VLCLLIQSAINNNLNLPTTLAEMIFPDPQAPTSRVLSLFQTIEWAVLFGTISSGENLWLKSIKFYSTISKTKILRQNFGTAVENCVRQQPKSDHLNSKISS